MVNAWSKAKYEKMECESFKKRNVGEIRQNQLITSFGVGAIVDFVDDTVVIANIDDWNTDVKYRIYNENLQSMLGVKYFVRPRTENEFKANWKEKSNDIPAYVFPENFYCTHCQRILTKNEYEESKREKKCINCGQHKSIVPARFIAVCEKGHMEDFPYSWWVHKGTKCSESKNPRIKLYNIDNRSDIGSLTIECEDCGNKRSMEGAFAENALSGENGYKCKGNHPHLPNYMLENQEVCDEVLKTRLRTASNVYFPVVKSALTIPPWSKKILQIISLNYEDLEKNIEFIPEEQIEKYLIKNLSQYVGDKINISQLVKAYYFFKEYKNENIIKTIKDIYRDEYDTICSDSQDDEEFESYLGIVPDKYKEYFDSVVILERLTEVQTLIGFTRLIPYSGDDIRNPNVVPLSEKATDWLPGIKMVGEGIFIKFNQRKIDDWLKHIGDRYNKLAENLDKSIYKNDRFSAQYVLLHTFSHLLLRQISNECGYNLASLKEKIYSTFYDGEDNAKMAGVLIYTSSTDSDGSLGGLISIASQTELLENIIDEMLDVASWCSADPLCSNSTEQGLESLNYSACHDCTLLPETSCEFLNVLLDRISIVGTTETRKIGFFGELV